MFPDPVDHQDQHQQPNIALDTLSVPQHEPADDMIMRRDIGTQVDLTQSMFPPWSLIPFKKAYFGLQFCPADNFEDFL